MARRDVDDQLRALALRQGLGMVAAFVQMPVPFGLPEPIVPAMVAREILLRLAVVRGRGWLWFVVTAVCLAISALYELVEWGAAVALGQGAEEFLATQGDPWDTQSDMALALIGAVCAQLLLGRAHDRALARLGPAPG
jgi:putative membrane protein